MVQYTREIAKIASVRDAKEHATEFFEYRNKDLCFFSEELHYGKNHFLPSRYILLRRSFEIFEV